MVKKSSLDEPATKKDLLGLEERLGGMVGGLGEKVGGLDSKVLSLEGFVHKIMKELQDFRQEQTLLSSLYGRVRDMEDQVEKLEKIHPNYQHATL